MKIAEKLKGGGKGGRDVGPGRPGGAVGWGGPYMPHLHPLASKTGLPRPGLDE